MDGRGTASYYIHQENIRHGCFVVLIAKPLQTTQIFIFMKMDKVWHIHRMYYSIIVEPSDLYL